MDNTNLYWSLVSAAAMMLVAIVAVAYWRRLTRVSYRWFWLGAALWAVAVAVKFSIPTSVAQPVFSYLHDALPYAAFVIVGGIYGGLESSLCEIGFTWLAALIWSGIGRDADHAIGIGLGAGAAEAFVLGLLVAAGISATLANIEGTEATRHELETAAATSPLFCLIGPTERIIAVLCHASSRALVLLGTAHRRTWMIVAGFAIFTAVDGIATAAQLTGKQADFSVWWVEVALLPMAVVSIPILRWCYLRWSGSRATVLYSRHSSA